MEPNSQFLPMSFIKSSNFNQQTPSFHANQKTSNIYPIKQSDSKNKSIISIKNSQNIQKKDSKLSLQQIYGKSDPRIQKNMKRVANSMLTSCLKSISSLFQAQSVIHDFSKFKPQYFEKWNYQIQESNKINEKRIARLISDMKFILRLPRNETGLVDEVSQKLKESIILEEPLDQKLLSSLLNIMELSIPCSKCSMLTEQSNYIHQSVFKQSTTKLSDKMLNLCQTKLDTDRENDANVQNENKNLGHKYLTVQNCTGNGKVCKKYVVQPDKKSKLGSVQQTFSLRPNNWRNSIQLSNSAERNKSRQSLLSNSINKGKSNQVIKTPSKKSLGTPVSKKSSNAQALKRSSSFKSPIFISKLEQVPLKNQILNSKFDAVSSNQSLSSNLAQRRESELLKTQQPPPQKSPQKSKFVPPISVPQPKKGAINSLDVVTIPTTTANSLGGKIFTNYNIDSDDRGKENSNRYYGDLKPLIARQRSINKLQKNLSIPKLGAIDFDEPIPKTVENRVTDVQEVTPRMTGSMAELKMDNYLGSQTNTGTSLNSIKLLKRPTLKNKNKNMNENKGSLMRHNGAEISFDNSKVFAKPPGLLTGSSHFEEQGGIEVKRESGGKNVIVNENQRENENGFKCEVDKKRNDHNLKVQEWIKMGGNGVVNTNEGVLKEKKQKYEQESTADIKNSNPNENTDGNQIYFETKSRSETIPDESYEENLVSELIDTDYGSLSPYQFYSQYRVLNSDYSIDCKNLLLKILKCINFNTFSQTQSKE